MVTSVSDGLDIAADARLVARRLLALRGTDGHWTGHLSSSALATSTAVTAIALALRLGVVVPGGDRHVQRGLAWLVRTQNTDGGWGDTPESISNISTTALVWAALSVRPGIETESSERAAADWIREATGGPEPARLAAALASRYGRDRTFSVPILTMCAIAGRLGPSGWSLIPQLPFELATLPRGWFGAIKLPVVSYALPALISMGIARHRAGARVPVLSAVRERATPKALRVLEGLQPSNGGFLEAVPLTAFVAMSLLAAGEVRHPAVGRGLDFLVQSVRDDGSWPIDTNLATWVTTLAVNGLADGHSWQELTSGDRERIREFLLRQQWRVEHPYTGAAAGGWAWTNLPGGVPDADDTAGALLALSHLGAEDSEAREAAAAGITWLLDLQNRDGGIPTFCRGWGTLPFDRSSTDLTAHALRAWSAWAPRLSEGIQARIGTATGRAVRYLARSQRTDGAFVPLWFGNQAAPAEENPVFGTSRVLKGLHAQRGGDAQRVRIRAAEYLRAAQNDDGGWGAASSVLSSIEETAVAVAALAPMGGVDQAAAVGGARWLALATDRWTSFPASPIGLYFARLWYSETLYPLLLTADALHAFGPVEGGRA